MQSEQQEQQAALPGYEEFERRALQIAYCAEYLPHGGSQKILEMIENEARAASLVQKFVGLLKRDPGGLTLSALASAMCAMHSAMIASQDLDRQILVEMLVGMREQAAVRHEKLMDALRLVGEGLYPDV